MPNQTTLDLYQLLVVDMFGLDQTVAFIFASFMVIAFIAAKFRMPNRVAFVIFILYGMAISTIFSMVATIVIFIAGLILASFSLKLITFK